MRFKVDENLSDQVKDYLVSLGHDADTARDEALNGRPDTEIAAAAKRENRILLSLDSDFANILIYPPEKYPGIIFLKLEKQDNPSVLENEIEAWNSLEEPSWLPLITSFANDVIATAKLRIGGANSPQSAQNWQPKA